MNSTACVVEAKKRKAGWRTGKAMNGSVNFCYGSALHVYVTPGYCLVKLSHAQVKWSDELLCGGNVVNGLSQ